jgi:hypothetical protein
MQFRLLPAGLEEAQFKRVPEGWLFTTVNPWVFAPRRTYLVSDAQKPAIAARVRRGRYFRLAVVLPMMVLPALAIIMYPAALVPMVTTFSLTAVLLFGAFTILSAVAITACDHLAVRSLLRDLPRSSQKIRYADMMQSQSKAMSVTAIAICASLFVLAAAANTYNALTSARSGWAAGVGAICCALFAAAAIGMLVAKLRTRHAG